ncbi:MAG TPA: DHA2 family efflux MFS transporter permease subunit [Candidatus Dormibacteraeota bacterium]|nr:DHA2 family efflux MFS transporter permease subunit [Candidatus Dormibacteraeota bacterium]
MSTAAALPAISDLGLRRPALMRWLVAIAVMTSAIMELVDTSAVNVSLPYIAGSLSATVNEATWVLTSYLVANAVLLPLTGWLANYFGRKRLLMIAVTGFTVASVCCGIAPTLPFLIFFRVLQGAMGGTLQPITRAIMLETFPREQRGQAMAFFGVGIVVAPILAPMLGGWLTTNYSWRWVFFVNIPISILALILVQTFVFDPSYIRRRSRRVDYWGMGMLVTGIAALQIMLDKGQEADWFSSHFIVALAVVAAVLLPAFIFWELRTKDPVVHLSLFRHRTFATGVLLSATLGLVLYGSIVLMPLFMQELLGFPAVTAGFWNSPRGLITLVMMPLAGFLIGRRWDMRVLLFCGLLVAAVGVYMFSHLNLNASPWDFVWPQVVMGVGLSFTFVPLSTITVDPIPDEEMGYATSLISVSRNLGASFGISVITTLIARRAQFHQDRLVSHLSQSNAAFAGAREALQKMFQRHGANIVTAGQDALAGIYQMMLHQAVAMSYLDGFRVLGVVFVLVSPLVWLMHKPVFKARSRGR